VKITQREHGALETTYQCSRLNDTARVTLIGQIRASSKVRNLRKVQLSLVDNWQVLRRNPVVHANEACFASQGREGRIGESQFNLENEKP
jgi:hypothetical protein